VIAQKISSGVGYFDKLINNINIGDNVIWQVETGAFVELFCRAFIRESVKEGKDIIFISFNNSPKNIIAKLGTIVNSGNVTVIDCFTSGKGNNSSIFLDLYKTVYKKYSCKVVQVERPGDVENFITVINRIEEAKPRGTRYVFDSMTGMQDLWGSDEQITKFFTRQCPRLYELDTVAYWIMEKNAHSEQFRAQINHITQVVVDLSIEGGACNLSVIKADNHPEEQMLKSHRYEVVNSNIEFLEAKDAGLLNMGRKIKEMRLQKEISQAQLAAEIGVTPSTISQVENNAISLSLPALLRMARALGVTVGSFFEREESASSQFIFRAKNRSTGVVRIKGAHFDSIIPDTPGCRTQAYIATIAPGTGINEHLAATKGAEFGFLLCGTLEFEIRGRAYTISEGDSVYFTSDIPSRWKNSSEKSAELLLVIAK
jgi:transcriptional regulator with XRE-family HTH domain